VLDAHQAAKVCSGFQDLHQELAKEYWPGPLTLVGPKSPMVSDLITAGQETVAVRSPVHPIFRVIIQGVGEPLAAPSANRFKPPSPTRASHVIEEFGTEVPVVDGGA